MTTDGPSPHLSWAELACADGTPYPEECRDSWGAKLGVAFEAIRARARRPIRVLSGYRTPAYNRRVPGAAVRSQHIYGRAIDLAPPDGWTAAQLLAAVEDASRDPGSPIHGIGSYAWGVHVDVRPSDGRIYQWAGQKPVQVVS